MLSELLPLDDERASAVRVYLAFAARAAVTETLARRQRELLIELHESVTGIFAGTWDLPAAHPRCVAAAHAAISLADGLALHACSPGGWPPVADLRTTLDHAVAALLRPPVA